MFRRRGNTGSNYPSFSQTLTATVTASDSDTFECGNVVRQSQPSFNPQQRLVPADVKDSDGNDFTVFS